MSGPKFVVYSVIELNNDGNPIGYRYFTKAKEAKAFAVTQMRSFGFPGYRYESYTRENIVAVLNTPNVERDG